MYLFSVDFSENNLLTEQLNLESLYDLPVLNKLLIEQQLINFIDLSVKKTYLTDCKNDVELSLFKTVTINKNDIFKELSTTQNNERFIAFRNDVYFEIDDLSLMIKKNQGLFCLIDKNGFAFSVIGTIGDLKRLYNKNLSIADFIKKCEKNNSVPVIGVNGYIKKLNSIKDYKRLLYDILNGKTCYKPPHIAEGVYIDGEVPKGDFSIVPPVYLGDTVQIESGSVIGPNTVIYDKTLVSEKTSIKNSILFENVFVSSNCFVDGSVFCDNASIKRNSAVFSGSIIGSDALIGEDMTVENDSIINRSVKYDKFSTTHYRKNKFFTFINKFLDLSPDRAALLGSAVAIVFNNPRVIVCSDGSTRALSLKLAFLSGLIVSGGEGIDIGITFKSQLFFSSKFCDCNYAVYFSEKADVLNIEIFNSKNEQISKSDCCNLFNFCNNNEIVLKKSDECKNIRQVKGLKRMYIQEIVCFSKGDLPFVVEVFCENLILNKTLDEIFKRCTIININSERVAIYMNESGTSVNIKYKGKLYPNKVLEKIAFFFFKENVNSKVFESDFYNSLWRCDSVFLVMLILNIMEITNKSLEVLVKDLPVFFIKSKNVDLHLHNSEIAEKLSSKFDLEHQNGYLRIKCKNGFVKVLNDRKNKKIKIVSSSKKLAASEELCDFFYNYLK